MVDRTNALSDLPFAHLVMKFAGINIHVFSNAVLLDKLKIFWEGSAEYVYYTNETTVCNEWKVYIDIADLTHEKTLTDINGKTVRLTLPMNSCITEVNSFLREFITKVTLAEGYVWLHASAFELSGKVIVVIGNKGDGKTTWLLTAICRKNARLIGNDQSPIGIDNGKLAIYRWRPDVKICPGTLDFVGLSFDYNEPVIDRYLMMPFLNQYEVIDFLELSERSNQIIRKFPLDKAFGITPATSNTISLVVFLKGEPASEIQRINEAEARLLWDKISNDPEIITPDKLENWNMHIPFWNKRVNGIKPDNDALKLGEESLEYLFKNIPVFKAYSRLSVVEIESFLDKISKENYYE